MADDCAFCGGVRVQFTASDDADAGYECSRCGVRTWDSGLASWRHARPVGASTEALRRAEAKLALSKIFSAPIDDLVRSLDMEAIGAELERLKPEYDALRALFSKE